MKIFNIESYSEFEEKFNDYNNDYIIINISADWCKPCNAIKESLTNFISNFDNNNSIFLKINYDLFEEEENFIEFFDVKKIPYFYIYKDKIKIKEFQTSNMEIIKNEIESELLKNDKETFNISNDF